MNNLDNFKEKLNLIKSIYSKKLKHISYLKFDNKELILWDKEVLFKIPCEFPTTAIVKTESIINLFNKMPNIDFTVEVKGNQLQFLSGKINILLPIIEGIKFPEVHPINFYKLPKSFMESLNVCRTSVSNNITDGIFTCFFINKDHIISCDNIRATKYILSDSVPDRFLLPSSFYKRIKDLSITSYVIVNNYICFAEKDFTICTSLIEDTYPNLDQYFQINGTSLNLLPEFVKMVDRVGFMIDTKEENEKECITVKLEKNKTICSSIHSEGTIQDEIDTNIIKNSLISFPYHFKINPHHFIEACKSFKTCLIRDNSLLFQKPGIFYVLGLMGK